MLLEGMKFQTNYLNPTNDITFIINGVFWIILSDMLKSEVKTWVS